MNLELSAVPPGVLVVLGVLALVQLALDVIALIDLARRPREAVVFGNKWAWLAIIVLVNLIGAILYLAVGRKPASPPEDMRTRPARGATAPSSVADKLYGRPEDRPGSRDTP